MVNPYAGSIIAIYNTRVKELSRNGIIKIIMFDLCIGSTGKKTYKHLKNATLLVM